MLGPSHVQGLIVRTRENSSYALEQFARSSGWPVVTNPELRTLAQQVSALAPICIAFWLEEPREVFSVQKLIAWVRSRWQTPYCIVLAYRVDPRLELFMRAVGANCYLPLQSDIELAFDEAVRPLFARLATHPTARQKCAAAIDHRGAARFESNQELSRPP